MRKSFTLVEIIIVISILALLISLSIPTLSRFKDSLSLESSAQEIASNLRRIQSEAVLKHQTLSFDPAQLDLPSGIMVTQPKIISFSASGYPVAGSSGTIILSSKYHFKKIIISSLGRVRVE